jgi:FAD/FMN-containing dehydrogenase
MSGALASWRNWAGNQSFTPARVVAPASESELLDVLRAAAAEGTPVRAAGAGHSFSPIVETPGLVIEQSGLAGVVGVDRERRTATVRAGTRICDLGAPLWEHGLALANQGDIDSQTIAGAVATATHGSGLRLGSISSTLVGARLATASGDVVEVAPGSELLRALQVSIGTLGVLTELTLQAVDAYELDEQIEVLSVDEVLDRWDELRDGHRHFSFFWLPAPESAAAFGLSADDARPDTCFVKLHRLADGGSAVPAGRRRDRSYRIYPSHFEPTFHEMEHMLPLAVGPEAFAEIRDLVRRRFPECTIPVEVRFTAADDAMLSPNHRRDSVVVSVSGVPGTDYMPFLRAVDELFDRFDGRPHWGKIFFMTRSRMERLFPELDAFRRIRHELDPDERLLNDVLRPLLGGAP